MTSPLQQKLKISGPSIVTANRTSDGVVIYRTQTGWSTELAQAAIVSNSADAQALLGAALTDDVHAVGAYVAPVLIDNAGHVAPGNLREKIRQDGLAIRLSAAS